MLVLCEMKLRVEENEDEWMDVVLIRRDCDLWKRRIRKKIIFEGKDIARIILHAGSLYIA